MGFLIDSSILIQFERGKLDLEKYLGRQKEEDFYLSVITVSELLHGVERAKDEQIRIRRASIVEAVFSRFSLIEINVETARTHAKIWADLAKRGMAIGPHDLWIAATCLTHGMGIITANIREFLRVPGLQVEVWNSAET